MPHVKIEKWRWLDFSQIGLADARVWTKPAFNLEVEFVFDGKEAPKQVQGLPQGLVICTFTEALERHPELMIRLLKRINQPSTEKFQALAEALAREGLFVYVPRGVKVEKVVVAKLYGVIEPGMTALRALIWLESGAELKLVLDLQGKSPAAADSLFHLAKTDLILEEDARLHFTDVSNLKQEVVNLRYSQARLERGAKLDWIYMATATALSKQSLQVNLG
jgi:Fe-S cluster assembly scaffold protein SufB